MSTALAIASVTAVLQKLLSEAMTAHDVSTIVNAPVSVSALAPDRIKTGDDESPQLNLFLYQVSPNTGWRNVGLPSRNGDGQRVSNPPLGLDLHYLLTAYGKRDLDSEVLLGHGMQALHEIPVLTRQAIADSLAPPSPLAASGLADQVELVKLMPESVSTEEISRLWSALQAHYRPTAAYEASVVLIEERRPTRAALPVQERNLRVVPFRAPRVEEVVAQAGPTEPIVAAATVRILGRHLRGEITKVRLGPAEVDPSSLTDTEINIPLTSPAIPVGVPRAGLVAVQVLHRIEFAGTPVPEHRGFESNVMAFVLRPSITRTGPTYDITANLQPDVNTTRKGTITVHLDLPVASGQRALLLLNQNVAAAPQAYSFDAVPRAADPNTVDAGISRVALGEYLVRVQVDGAESPIDLDPTSPTFGPTVVIA